MINVVHRLRRLVTYHLVILGLLFPAMSLALGLGKLDTFSHLNEPVKAQVHLIGLGDIGLSNISVALAKPTLFARVGVPFSEEALKLRFKLLRATDGSPYIDIYSTKPIRDPNVPFLLQITWPGGNLLRQYTLLLTPEEHTLPKSKKTAKKPASKSNSASSAVTKAGKTYYGPTVKEDRLWAIATHYRPDPIVSTPQTAVAIFLMNPHAFTQSSPSNLKQGVTLTLPSLGVVKRIPDRTARQILAQKAVNITQLQKKYGITAVKPTGVLPIQTKLSKEATKKTNQPINKTTTSNNTQSKTKTKPTIAKDVDHLTHQVLHLAEQKNHQLEVQLLAAQNNDKTLQKTNQTQAKRIAELEKILQSRTENQHASATNDRSTQISQLHEANQQLNAKIVALERQYDLLKLANQEQIVRIGKLQETNNTLLEQKRGRHNTHVIDKSLEKKNLVSSDKPKTGIPLNKVISKQAKSHDQPMLSLFWLIAIGIVIVAIFYWLFTKWRALPRDEPDDETTGSLESEPDASVAASIVFTKGSLGDEKDNDNLPTQTQETHQNSDGAVQTSVNNEQLENTNLDVDLSEANTLTTTDNLNLDSALLSDPIEEADVYLAYDRFEQAEKVLLNALAQKPEHHSWRIKLLAVYSKMHDLDQFNYVLTQIPQTFLDEHPQFSEQVSDLMKTFSSADNTELSNNSDDTKYDVSDDAIEVDLETDLTDSQQAQPFSSEEETTLSDADNSIPLNPNLGVSLESEESDNSDSFEAVADEFDADEQDKEPEINVETLTAKKDSASDEAEQVTVAEVLVYAEQLISEGDTSTAEKLLTKAYYQGTPEERDKARQLLDSLDKR